MENTSKSLHPLIIVAATSVTIASLAAVAHFTGLLPTRGGEPAAATQAAPAPVAGAAQSLPAPVARTDAQPAGEAAKPAARPRPQPRQGEAARQAQPANDNWRYEGGSRRVATNNAGIDVIAAQPAPAAGPAPQICRDCGTVESVQEVATKGEGSGLGAVAGGVLGGVLGNQVGGGTGKDLATIAGAVGGAFAGHEVEKNMRTNKQYQVTVRFDDGSVRSFKQPGAGWRVGERVRASNGSLSPL